MEKNAESQKIMEPKTVERSGNIFKSEKTIKCSGMVTLKSEEVLNNAQKRTAWFDWG